MSRHDARRQPQFTGPAGWADLLPAEASRPVLEGQNGCDIAIIGAGYAGLSAARKLKQIDPALDVVVLDAARLGEGGTGRNSGFMIDLPHELTASGYEGGGETRDRQLTRLNRQAIDFAAQAVEEFAIPEGFFQRIGKVNGAGSDVGMAANHAYAEHLRSLGEAFELLDARAMRELTGSDYYHGGLHTPGTALIQPAGYARGLAKGLERAGVRIFVRSGVTRIESDASGWRLATGRGSLRAQRVILANNGHLESFGFARGRLMHIMLNACMTAELTADQIRALGGSESWGITPADPMGTTVRRIGPGQGGNRIVIRQGSYYRPEMATSEADLARASRNMREKFEARFPMLKTVPFEYAWSGHLCLSRNAASVMRELEPGLFAACVQNGLGTVRGTLSGIGAAELACGQQSEITRYFAAEAEPARLPPHPFDTIGANAYLRLKEWQSRRE
ncbi:FAD-binding oxidoreductase [Sedimentimonas flavescens]|uniref:FAD-binding oxidoreductase n=1 Tax=Sedimentimonas flavescens TaxID=2851012 RepID=A0ABT2ZZY1_9RHOB|nr:FAD-binding oxidoreductase [Sedimentimonas flavescens]MCV2879318.1 FAD-binding oxidoreductase [Sedimentimonas flavescens]